MAKGKLEMKKLVLISILTLMIVFPSVVFAGNATWNAKATFWNESTLYPNAGGTADITYNSKSKEWTISLNITGLLANHDYIFNISLENQLMIRADYLVHSTDGNLSSVLKVKDVVSQLTSTAGRKQSTYSIVRILDMSGDSGGLVLSSDNLEPTPETNPYLPGNPFATMVMRAREDGIYGSLAFTQPRK